MRARSHRQQGFTLLEVLVASLVMALAVGGLLSSLSTSLRTGSRIIESDRAAAIARAKMQELLLQMKLPHNAEVAGPFAPAESGWQQSGWRAIVQPFEIPPGAGPGSQILERIRLEVWWNAGGTRHTFPLESYRANRMQPGDVAVPQ